MQAQGSGWWEGHRPRLCACMCVRECVHKRGDAWVCAFAGLWDVPPVCLEEGAEGGWPLACAAAASLDSLATISSASMNFWMRCSPTRALIMFMTCGSAEAGGGGFGADVARQQQGRRRGAAGQAWRQWREAQQGWQGGAAAKSTHGLQGGGLSVRSMQQRGGCDQRRRTTAEPNPI